MTQVRHLRGAPSTAELYARAAAGAVLPDALWGGGRALPNQELELWDVRIDRNAVARYARLTGFSEASEGDAAIPATYPSLLGFGLGPRLMTDRAFPLPALGMVHVADRITVHRPLRCGEAVRVAVCARDLRSHPKGAEVDIVTEVQTRGEIVWREVSTYLSRRWPVCHRVAHRRRPSPRCPVTTPPPAPGSKCRATSAAGSRRCPVTAIRST